MFGFGKKTQNNGLSSKLYEFLTDADRAYTNAIQTRSVSLMKDYFERDCLFQISPWIQQAASVRLVLNEKFRKTDWTIESENDYSITLIKSCVYNEMRLTKAIKTSMGDNYTERWFISKEPEFLVTGIQLLEDFGGF